MTQAIADHERAKEFVANPLDRRLRESLHGGYIMDKSHVAGFMNLERCYLDLSRQLKERDGVVAEIRALACASRHVRSADLKRILADRLAGVK